MSPTISARQYEWTHRPGRPRERLRIPQRGRRPVVELYHDLVGADLTRYLGAQRPAVGIHLDGLGTEPEAEAVHAVASPGQQPARAVQFWVEPPASRLTRLRRASKAAADQRVAHHHHLADAPGVDQRLGHGVARPVTVAVGDHQLSVRALRRLDDAVALGQGHLHRLFEDHVLAGLKGHQRMLHVQAVRRGDGHRVDIRPVQERLERRLAVDAVLGRECLAGAGRLRCVRDGDNLGLIAAHEPLGVRQPHVPDSHDADAKLHRSPFRDRPDLRPPEGAGRPPFLRRRAAN